jgi:hypothetical protein
MRSAFTLLFLLAGLGAVTTPALAQRDTVLAHRWVGTHLGRPLHFEFYGDTMMVVNDRHVLDYRLTRDSLIAVGDTTVIGRYRLSMGYLLFSTPDGVVTMAKQSFLARPLTGIWVGPLGTPDGAQVELRLHASGVARWRRRSRGGWTTGEWERTFRVITFVWEDEEETEWRALYDPIANALLFEITVPDAETTILRRSLR